MSDVILKLEDAMRMIPYCRDKNDAYAFTTACDLAINSVEKLNIPILTKYITTKISGKALETIKYKNLTTWDQIKSHLNEHFEAQYSKQNLHLELTSIKQQPGETITSYNDRIDDIYFKLCNLNNLSYDTKEKISFANELLKETTLENYIKGLIKPIKFQVKAQKPLTIEIAKDIARNEELEFNTERERIKLMTGTRQYNNNSNNNNNNNNNSYRNNFQRLNNNNYNGNARPQSNMNNNYTNNTRSQNFPNPNRFNNRTNYENKNNPNKNIQCYICNGNHIARQCRNNQMQQTRNNNRPPPNRNYDNNTNNNNRHFNKNNNFTRPPTNYNTRPITCNYCNKTGHTIAECYKKKNDENKNSKNVMTADVECGLRSVNQLIATENESHIASTSYHQ